MGTEEAQECFDYTPRSTDVVRSSVVHRLQLNNTLQILATTHMGWIKRTAVLQRTIWLASGWVLLPVNEVNLWNEKRQRQAGCRRLAKLFYPSPLSTYEWSTFLSPLTHFIRRVFKVEEICCVLRLLISEPKIKVKFSLSIFLNELNKQNPIMLSEAKQQHLIAVPSEHSLVWLRLTSNAVFSSTSNIRYQ